MQKITSLCSATYVRWQRGTARIRPPHATAAAIDRYLLPPGPQQQTRRTLLQWENGTDRRTDTVPIHRPCSTYYTGIANKRVGYRTKCFNTDLIVSWLAVHVRLRAECMRLYGLNHVLSQYLADNAFKTVNNQRLERAESRRWSHQCTTKLKLSETISAMTAYSTPAVLLSSGPVPVLGLGLSIREAVSRAPSVERR